MIPDHLLFAPRDKDKFGTKISVLKLNKKKL